MSRAADAAGEKVSMEMFTFTYGALVTQMLKDFESTAGVNAELFKMGEGIGGRIIDEYLAKTRTYTACKNFKETANAIAKVAFKMFLGFTCEVTKWDSDGKSCSLILPPANPFSDFVELPDGMDKLWYSNLICGVIVGALSAIKMNVKCKFVKDRLHGHSENEIRMALVSLAVDEAPPEED